MMLVAGAVVGRACEGGCEMGDCGRVADDDAWLDYASHKVAVVLSEVLDLVEFFSKHAREKN